jgi:rod shape-determining protein MreD
MRRFLATFATLVLLWAFVSQLNHELAPLHVFLFVDGLFVAYAALVLPWGTGFAAVLAAGMVCDANAAAPFGLQVVLFAAAHAVLFHLRDRLPRDEMVGRVAIALLTNFALLLALSFLQIDRGPFAAARWIRLGSDLVCSQLFLALVAPWFFALQEKALVLARAEPGRLL